jgi:hypothetical protein
MAVAAKHLVPLDFFLGSNHLIDGYVANSSQAYYG